MVRGDISKSQGKEERFNTMIFVPFVVIAYVLSSRGREGLMMNFTRIVKEIGKSRKHLTMSFKGK